MIVTSVAGHIMDLEFAKEFQGWTSCNPVALFTAPIVKSVDVNFKNVEKNLKQESKRYCFCYN